MPAIPYLTPIPHPSQPGVTLDALAVEGLTLTSGSAIDGPAALRVHLRPFAEVQAGEAVACLSAPNLPLVAFELPDLFAWIARRAEAGDMQPAQALGLLVQCIGEEYVRQNTPAESPTE